MCECVGGWGFGVSGGDGLRGREVKIIVRLKEYFNYCKDLILYFR